MKGVKHPLLSVIVPIYNVEDYLNECIESIIKQTYKDLEIILVDDGSTDKSGIICDEYVKKDGRICVIHKTNKGLLEARLTGVEKAKGKYITFVDSDDWIVENMYEDLLRTLETSNAEIVICGIYRYWNESEIAYDIPCLDERVYKRRDIERKIIPFMLWNICKGRKELDPSLCSKIFARNIIKDYLQKAQQLDIYFGEDTSVIYPMMLEVKSIVVVKKCYYYHRQRRKGEIASYITDKMYFENLYKLFIYLKQIFEGSNYSDVLLKQLDYFYMRLVQVRRDCYTQIYKIDEYLFPYNAIPADADIVLYGAGKVGRTYKEQNDKYHFCNIVLWVDKRADEWNKLIYLPKEIDQYSYDYILVAVNIPELAKEIIDELILMGVKAEKIIWTGINIYNFFNILPAGGENEVD
ncbi:putative glycosyltransferase EpsJ [Lachnospiraceae bacterium]|nr:putative glycosyltransferase EpsJ [Lachnospiraceae bacterium]